MRVLCIATTKDDGDLYGMRPPMRAPDPRQVVHYAQGSSVKAAGTSPGHVGHIAIDFRRAGSYNFIMALEKKLEIPVLAVRVKVGPCQIKGLKRRGFV